MHPDQTAIAKNSSTIKRGHWRDVQVAVREAVRVRVEVMVLVNDAVRVNVDVRVEVGAGPLRLTWHR